MLRTVLTVLIIALGITALVVVNTAIKAINQKFTESFSTMGASGFTIRYKDRNIRFGGGGGSEIKKEKKGSKKEKKSNKSANVEMWLLIVLAILLPPLAVYLHQGEINGKFWLSILFWFLFIIPGVIYALLVVTNTI